jgi:WD40 repeat protein
MRIDFFFSRARNYVWLMNCIISLCSPILLAQEPRPPIAKVDELGDPLPPHASRRFGTVRFRHPSPVVELALSPDNKTVISSGERELMAWDSVTGVLRWREAPDDGRFRLPGAAYGIRGVAFGKNSHHFYSASQPNEVLKWNTSTGATETIAVTHSLPLLPSNRPLNGLPGSSRSVDVSADGTKLALAGAHGVVVCDTNGQSLFEVPNAPAGEILTTEMQVDPLLFGGHYSMAIFSPSGDEMALVTSDSPDQIRLVNANSGELVRRITLSQRLVRMTFSPDGSKLFTTERDSSIRQYSVANGKRVWEYIFDQTNQAESYTSGVAISPDGELTAVCAPIASGNWIYLLNSETGKVIARLEGHSWKPTSVAFSSDGHVLYSSGWDGAIRRWEMQTFQQLAPPVGTRGSRVVAATPNAQLIAHADDLGHVLITHSRTGETLLKIPPTGMRLNQLAFSADGNQLAGGGSNETHVGVVAWDLTTGSERQRWHWPKEEEPLSTVQSLAFSPNGQRLAVAIFQQSLIRLLSPSDGRLVAELPHPQVYGVSMSVNSNQLASVGWDKKIRFWNSTTGAPDHELDLPAVLKDGNDSRMYGVCYSPRGDSLATAHLDGTVRVWNSNDWSLKNRLSIGGSFVHGAITYSPDGMWLTTGVSSGEVTIWDPRSGKAMWDFGRHESYVYAVHFVDQGKALVSSGEDGVAYCWDLHSPPQAADSDLPQLWRDLGGSDERNAHHAIWRLIQIGEPTVVFVETQLAPLKSLIAIDSVSKGLDAGESERRRRLALQLVEKDARVELEHRVQRALEMLGQFNSDSAMELLQRFAAGHAIAKVQKEASEILQAIERERGSRQATKQAAQQ